MYMAVVIATESEVVMNVLSIFNTTKQYGLDLSEAPKRQQKELSEPTISLKTEYT